MFGWVLWLKEHTHESQDPGVSTRKWHCSHDWCDSLHLSVVLILWLSDVVSESCWLDVGLYVWMGSQIRIHTQPIYCLIYRAQHLRIGKTMLVFLTGTWEDVSSKPFICLLPPQAVHRRLARYCYHKKTPQEINFISLNDGSSSIWWWQKLSSS